jgi:hypothetical protein
MKLFCEELTNYLMIHRESEFQSSVPVNVHGEFDNLCEMSTTCSYVSGIDVGKHRQIIQVSTVYINLHP